MEKIGNNDKKIETKKQAPSIRTISSANVRPYREEPMTEVTGFRQSVRLF